jgi:DNA-binding NarL/FixJ family response regulator
MSAFENSSLGNNNAKPIKVGGVKPMKLLLVEDSTLLREVLFETINNLKNLSVEGMAANQTKAIALLNEKQFDILLLDIELSEGNGFEVIKHTKTNHYPFRPPILIMLTNHANPHYRSMAKDLGVHYFFDKSMDFDLAIQAIEFEAERFNKELGTVVD